MQTNPNIFRAYDIRGVVGSELSEDLYHALGRAYATVAAREDSGEVYVGYDGRLSSADFARALIDGLQASGAQAVNVGRVPSPLLYFAALRSGGSGVMITGSHNPSEYNGCKMMINGHTLETVWIQELRQIIEDEIYLDARGSASTRDFFPDYLQAVQQRVRIARPLKIVIDAGNGIAGAFAPQLFRSLGCEVVELFCEVDGNFPNHHPDPGQPKNVRQLQEQVLAQQADLGFGFDGDADRLGVIDNQGRLIFPDKVLMLLAQDALSRHPGGSVIFDVKCSRHLPEVIEKHGGKPIMYKTGHSLIKKKIKEVQALVAGEMSGHLFVCEDWNGADDAIFVAAIVAMILSQQSSTLAQLFDRYPQSLSTPEINIAVPEADKFAICERLHQQGDFGSDARIVDIDGVRVELPQGWGLIRASNTTPTLVLRLEAESAEALESIRQLLARELGKVAPGCSIPPISAT